MKTNPASRTRTCRDCSTYARTTRSFLAHAARRPARHSLLVPAVLAALAASAGPLANFASAQAGRQATPRAAAPTAAPATQGLDALSDEQVMSELSSMKLESLLNRMFEVDHVSREQQESIRSLGALRELAASGPISNSRRMELVRRAVEGVTLLLPKMHNPIDLMNQAATLIIKGIEPDINTLEFWGENPTLQARVKPATDLAVKMLDQAGADAEAQEKQIENTIKTANDPRADLYMKLDGVKTQAKYLRNMIAYYQAMAIDTSGGANKAAVAERAKVCKAAINYLKEFDVPGEEGGGVQPIVHNRIGKLYMAMGDWTKAQAYMDSEVTGKTMPDGKPIDPAPNAGQQYEARYFSAVCDVLDKKPDNAAKELDELVKWQKTALPKEAQSGVDAAADMLRYRIFTTKADLASDPKEKDNLNNQGAAVLNALGDAHPEFKGIITEQLVNRLPDNAKLGEQNVAVLQALVSKGMAERLKPENVPLDQKVMNRAVEAARVLAVRPEGPGLSAQAIQDDLLIVPVLLDRMGKDVEAGNAYLDFAQKYPANRDAGSAVDRAVTLAFKTNRADASDPKAQTEGKKLYRRALGVAVNPPWSRKELAYYYAELLRTTGQPREAVAYYKMVPKGDKMEFSARFFELAALNDAMDDPKTPPAEREKSLTEATALVDEVRSLAATAPQNDTTKVRVALTTLMGAELAVKQKQGPRALQLLQNIEQVAQGAPKIASDVMNKATYLRAQAYIANNQLDKATEQVVALANTSPQAAQKMATDLLDQLDKDFKREEANNQKKEEGETALNMSLLTNFMVDFCQKSKDPETKKNLPAYQIYDAKIKLRAGTLLADPAAKKKALTEALAAYEKLRQSEPDNGNVTYGIGMAQFELQDWAAAANTLGILVKDGKLGGPQSTLKDELTGEYKTKDNPIFWEGYYKWIKSNAELGKSDPAKAENKEALASAKGTLINLLAQYGNATGGPEWHDKFEDLRKELAPNFDPNTLPTKLPTSGPSSRPAGATVPATQAQGGAAKPAK